MKKKICLLLAFLLCIACLPALAGAPASKYTVPNPNGSLFDIYVEPNGDLVAFGVGFPAYDADFPVDGTVARITPEGEIVWHHHFPYTSELGAGNLLRLSDGSYVKPEFGEHEVFELHFFDAEKGYQGVSEPSSFWWTVPVDGYLLLTDQMTEPPYDLVVRWQDLSGEEVRQRRYKMPDRMYGPMVYETKDGLLLQLNFESQENGFMLLKLDKEGVYQWEEIYPFQGYVNHAAQDARGGLFVMSDPGAYSGTNRIAYIDKDGEMLWDRPLFRGNSTILSMGTDAHGWRMLWETNDTLQFKTLDRKGTLRQEPVREKPLPDRPDTNYWIRSTFTDNEGDLYLNGTIISKDFYHYYESFILPLDAFAETAAE